VLFAHDTDVALAAAAALVNTEQPDGDALADVAGLDAFVREWGWTGSRRHDAAELEQVRALRSRLHRLWHVDQDGAVELVNAVLREARVLPQLVRHDGWDYHLHATPSEAPLADRMAVEAAMAMADVVRQHELERLRVCAAEGCGDVLVDLSKNRSRRFCGTACANRTHVAAFRARRAARPG
jgi:predicted RNA-binding Zn ribbon-like protein